jgi:hypothetical protein
MKEPIDLFKDLTDKPVFVPVDFAPDVPDLDDPLTILLRKERNGEFLFSEDNGPFANQY